MESSSQKYIWVPLKGTEDTHRSRLCCHLIYNGSLSAENDPYLKIHPLNIPNSDVIRLMQSFKAKKYVSQKYVNRVFHWTVTDKGLDPLIKLDQELSLKCYQFMDDFRKAAIRLLSPIAQPHKKLPTPLPLIQPVETSKLSDIDKWIDELESKMDSLKTKSLSDADFKKWFEEHNKKKSWATNHPDPMDDYYKWIDEQIRKMPPGKIESLSDADYKKWIDKLGSKMPPVKTKFLSDTDYKKWAATVPDLGADYYKRMDEFSNLVSSTPPGSLRKMLMAS